LGIEHHIPGRHQHRRRIQSQYPAENAIRPFVIGRKNWLFSASVRGAKSSANLYGLIETAKANELEPYAYLYHVFKELPKARSIDDIEALLPWNVNTQTIAVN